MLASLFLTFVSISLFANEIQYISEPQTSNTQPIKSGNKQHGAVSSMLEEPLFFFVSDSFGNPVPDSKVYLEILYAPDNTKNTSLSQRLVFTDSTGVATVQFTLGDKAGEYAIMAKLPGNNDHNRSQFVVYRFYARDTDWIVQLTFGLLGGLALFLFGIYLMSEGLKKTAGDKMRTILSQLTNNRIVGVGLGTIGTVIIPSSSAISVMLVSFVNAGLMTFRQTLAVILGAAIGTTIIAQLIAFKLTDYSLLFIAIGALLHLFSNSEKLKNTGEGLLGFGILFYGMDIMSIAMNPLRTYQPFISLILQLENPILGVLLGTILTALIQSSSAFIGILMILASQGLVSLELSMAFVLGANLGTPVTALLACLKTTQEAQKVAIAQFVYKLILVLAFIGLIAPVAELIRLISPDSTTLNAANLSLPRQIANSHTLYNIALTIIALPLTGPFAQLIHKLFKKESTEVKSYTKYINDKVISTPALAVDLAKNEMSRLWKRVFSMYSVALQSLLENDDEKLSNLEDGRQDFKAIRDEIRQYLFKILRSADNETAEETHRLLHILAELSHVNDLITKNLHRRAEKWIAREYGLSEESQKQLVDYHKFSNKMLENSLKIFTELDTKKAMKMQKKYKAAKQIAEDLEHDHYSRIASNESAEDIENGKTFIELIHTFRAISEHSRNIAKTLLDSDND